MKGSHACRDALKKLDGVLFAKGKLKMSKKLKKELKLKRKKHVRQNAILQNNTPDNTNNTNASMWCNDPHGHILRACKRHFVWHVRLRRLAMLNDSEIMNNKGKKHSFEDLIEDEEIVTGEIDTIARSDLNRLETKSRKLQHTSSSKKCDDQMRWWDKGTALVLLNGVLSNSKQAESVASHDWLACPGRCGRNLRTRNIYGEFCLNTTTCNSACCLPQQNVQNHHNAVTRSVDPLLKSLEKTSARAKSIGQRLLPQIQTMLVKLKGSGQVVDACGGIYTFIS